MARARLPRTVPSRHGTGDQGEQRTCDVRVREQMTLYLQSTDFEPPIFDDVYRGAALDPVNAVFVRCRVS